MIIKILALIYWVTKYAKDCSRPIILSLVTTTNMDTSVIMPILQGGKLRFGDGKQLA